MANWLTFLLCVSSVAITFAITTVLAHRTHPHARHERVLGLGFAIALVTLCAWIASDLLSPLSELTQGVLTVTAVLICVGYAYVVLESRSILRYAGVGFAIVLWLVALASDAFSASNYLPWATSLVGVTASINFLGHLLRARVNKALLRAPKEARLRAPNVRGQELAYHSVRLFLDNPTLAQSVDGQKILEGLTLSSDDLPALISRLMKDFAGDIPLEENVSDITIKKTYFLSALYPLIAIWAHVFKETRPLVQSYRYHLSFDAENIWLDIDGQTQDSNELDTRALKKFIYDQSADLVDVELKDKELHVRIGYRLPY